MLLGALIISVVIFQTETLAGHGGVAVGFGGWFSSSCRWMRGAFSPRGLRVSALPVWRFLMLWMGVSAGRSGVPAVAGLRRPVGVRSCFEGVCNCVGQGVSLLATGF